MHALIFSGGSPGYDRVFRRFVTAQGDCDVPNPKHDIWRKKISDKSEVADVASYPIVLELQSN